MIYSDSAFVSKFINLIYLDGFSFSFLLFVPFTLNENPQTVSPIDSINFSGKGRSISCGLNSKIFSLIAIYSYNFLPRGLNLLNCGSLMYGF